MPGALPRQTRRYLTLEDDVHLPRLYFAWHSPAIFSADDAELDVLAAVLSQGKASRLYRALVYEQGSAQDVDAFQSSAMLGSTFNIEVTARPSVDLEQLAASVWSELEAVAGTVTEPEVLRAVRHIETNMVDSLQTVGGFGGRADRLNHYAFYVGDPGYVSRDLARYEAVQPAAVARAARTYLLGQDLVVLSVVPKGSAQRALRAAG